MSVINEDELLPGDNQLKQCRICLDNDNPNDIISPCLCSGGSAYIHRKCLNNWRSENANGKAFKFCDVCQFEYIIETVIDDPKAERERLFKYHFFVIRDLTLITLLIQSVIVGLAFLLKRIDRNSSNIKNLFPDSMNGYVVYYLSGFILLLAIVGLIASIIFCCASVNSGSSGSSSRRSTSSRYSSGSSSNSNGFFGVVVAVVLICAFVGMFVGIVLSVIVLRKIMKHHTSKLWLRQEAEKYVVKDFTGKRKELEKYTRNHRNSRDTLTGDTGSGSARN
jgi:hypothetical protein